MHKNEIEVGIHRCVQGAFEYAVVTDRVLSALTGCDYLIKESDSLNNRNCRLLQQRDCADQALRVREHAGFKCEISTGVLFHLIAFRKAFADHFAIGVTPAGEASVETGLTRL